MSVLDLSEEYKVFEACMTIARATDVESGFSLLLKAVENMGYRWARIYTHKDGKLQSTKFQYGLEGSDKEIFESGGVLLERRESWRCLKENRVIVFCRTKTDQVFSTVFGITVRGITKPNDGIVRKALGDFWIEAPLMDFPVKD